MHSAYTNSLSFSHLQGIFLRLLCRIRLNITLETSEKTIKKKQSSINMILQIVQHCITVRLLNFFFIVCVHVAISIDKPHTL